MITLETQVSGAQIMERLTDNDEEMFYAFQYLTEGEQFSPDPEALGKSMREYGTDTDCDSIAEGLRAMADAISPPESGQDA